MEDLGDHQQFLLNNISPLGGLYKVKSFDYSHNTSHT